MIEIIVIVCLCVALILLYYKYYKENFPSLLCKHDFEVVEYDPCIFREKSEGERFRFWECREHICAPPIYPSWTTPSSKQAWSLEDIQKMRTKGYIFENGYSYEFAPKIKVCMKCGICVDGRGKAFADIQRTFNKKNAREEKEQVLIERKKLAQKIADTCNSIK